MIAVFRVDTLSTVKTVLNTFPVERDPASVLSALLVRLLRPTVISPSRQ